MRISLVPFHVRPTEDARASARGRTGTDKGRTRADVPPWWRAAPGVTITASPTRRPPTEAGWYATVHGWEIQEGASGGAHYWDGKRWLYENGTVVELPILVFASHAEADAYADANDLGW